MTVKETLAEMAGEMRTEIARLQLAGHYDKACDLMLSARCAEQLAGIKPAKTQRDLLEDSLP